MTRLEQVRQRLADIDADCIRLADIEDITPDDDASLTAQLAERATLAEELGRLEVRAAQIDAIRNAPVGGLGDGSTINRDVHVKARTADDIYDLNRSVFMGEDREVNSELNGRAMKSVESIRGLDDANREALMQKLEKEKYARKVAIDSDFKFRGLAEHILRTGGDTYREGFNKYLSGERDSWTNEERAAMSLTNANGGYTLPYLLDPSIILLNAGVVNPFRQIATIKQGNQNVWHGVSSAGVTAEWLAETSEAADKSPTVALITLTAYKASAWIQATQEFYEDGNIDSEIGFLVADAKATLESAAFATGNGTTAPQGIVTALGLVTASRISGSSNTAGVVSTATLSLTDIYAMDNDLGPRYRPNASWVGNKTILNSIRRLAEGTSANNSTFWQDLGGGLPSQLIGYPVYQSSDMDSTVVSGSTDDVLVLGDFRNYFIYDRLGVQIAFEPMVKGAAFRPTGHVGWWAHWRVGAGASTEQTAAFRLLRM